MLNVVSMICIFFFSHLVPELKTDWIVQCLFFVEFAFKSIKYILKMDKLDVREGQDKKDVMHLEREVEMLVMTHSS